jgi:hypothetical protein
MSRAGARAAKLLTKDEARRIAANVAKLPELLPRQNNKAHRVLRPVGLSLPMLELLWLFYGFGGLHVHSAPCLTSLLSGGSPRFSSLLSSGSSRFTSLLTTGASRLTTLLATGAPRGSPVFMPFHTGHRLGAWCWSGRCWSGWLCLSLSI